MTQIFSDYTVGQQVKMLKRELKGSVAEERIEEIKKIVGELKTEDPDTLKGLNTLKNRLHKKEQILQARAHIQDLQNKSGTPPKFLEAPDMWNDIYFHNGSLKISELQKELGELPRVLVDHFRNVIAAAETSTKNRLKALLIAYAQDKTRYAQIIEKNPAEIPIDFPSMLEDLGKDWIEKCIEEAKVTLTEEEAAKITALDTAPEQLCQTIIPPLETPLTLEERLEALQFLIQNSPKKEGEILVSGAGPGGLMTTLLALVHGREVTLLEKRREGAERRANIVALGKESSSQCQKMFTNDKGKIAADIYLLQYFGIMDHLLENKKITNLYNIVEVSIKDIEESMLHIAKTLGEERLNLHQEAEIESIDYADGKTQVHYHVGEEKRCLEPKTVYVMEGTRSKTRDLLGIDVIKESKKSRMAFAYYTVEEGTIFQWLEEICTILCLIPKIVWLLLQLCCLDKEKYSDELSLVVKLLGKAELLLNNPTTHYLYFNLTKEEEENLQQLEAEGTDIDSYLHSISDSDYQLFKIFFAAMGYPVSLTTSYSNTVSATSWIQRAEKSHVQIGDTHFVLGGDAETTTDPLSGSGMRTTLLRSSIATLAFSNGLASDPIGLSFYEKTESDAARSMRQEGFHEQQQCDIRRDRLERYLSLAEELELISTEEFYRLLTIQGKFKNFLKDQIPTSLTEEEGALLDKITSLEATEKTKDVLEKIKVLIGLDRASLSNLELSPVPPQAAP